MSDDAGRDGHTTSGPPLDWPATGPVGPAAGERRRGRWPWVAGAAGLLVVAGGVAGAAVLLGDDGGGGDDEAYCDALDTRGRADVPVIVFLLPEATADGVARLESEVGERPGVTDVVYVDRETSYAEAQELFADDPTARDLLQPEDLPTSLRLTVPDADALRTLEADLEDELLVLSIQAPQHRSRSVRELAQLVVDEDLEGTLGRFGHWVAPDVADQVREPAPDAVADDVDLLLDALAADDGVVEARHVTAMETVLADAETRCP